MHERVYYGFEYDKRHNRRLYVKVPIEVWRQAETTRKFGKVLKGLTETKRRAISIDLPTDVVRLVVNNKNLFRADDKKTTAANIIRILKAVEAATTEEYADPFLKTNFGLMPEIGSRAIASSFDIQWPSLPESLAGNLATDIMREMAANTGFAKTQPSKLRPIQANLDRMGAGAQLAIRPSTGTYFRSGPAHRPENATVHLAGENVQNHLQQLIGLAGAVAIAHADQLVKE